MGGEKALSCMWKVEVGRAGLSWTGGFRVDFEEVIWLWGFLLQEMEEICIFI